MSNPTWDDTEEVSTKATTKTEVPTWDDTQETMNVFEQPDVGAIEANRNALMQGASFGLADEATAGVKALYDTIAGDKKFADLLDTYRGKVKEERQALETGKQQYPASTTMAEIGGAILPGFATGGIGAVSNIGKVGALESALALGKAGATQGALQGFGESEADLTQPSIEGVKELGKDIGLGGLVGGVAGATIPMAAKGATKLAKSAVEGAVDLSPKFVRRGVEAFNIAEQGIPVVGDDANKKLQSDALKTAENLLNEFRGQYKRGSEKVGTALTSADTQVDLSSKLKDLESTLKSSSMLPDDLAKIQKELDNYKDMANQYVVEPGIDKAITRMEKMIEKETEKASMLGRDVSFGTPQQSDNFLNTLQENMNKQGEVTSSKVLQSAIPEDVMGADYKSMNLSDLNNVKAQLKDILTNSNIDSKSKGIVSNLVKEVDDAIRTNMDEVGQEFYRAGNQEISNVYRAGDIFSELSPDNRFAQDLDIPLAKKLLGAENLKGESLERTLGYGTEIPEALQKEAQQLNIRQGLSKSLQGEGSILGGFVNPSSMAVRSGAGLGNITRKAENVIKPVGDFTKKIIKMEDSAISNIANKLKNSGDESAIEFGDKLDKILQSPKRDRLLWSLSQQPAFRELINKQESEQQN